MDLLQWPKRARRETNDVANRRVWKSKCKRYVVIESCPKYGQLSTIYYALMITTSGGTTIISKHRKQNTAMAACQAHLAKINKS